jgi:hypothetical protein
MQAVLNTRGGWPCTRITVPWRRNQISQDRYAAVINLSLSFALEPPKRHRVGGSIPERDWHDEIHPGSVSLHALTKETLTTLTCVTWFFGRDMI